MTWNYHSIRSVLSHLAALALTTPVASQTTRESLAASLYSDPKHDFYNPLKYIASNTLTATAFAIVLPIVLIQTYYAYRYGARWMLAMVIGGYTYAIGFGFRFALHDHPDSRGIYIAEYLFIVLSPCAFIAANYVLLGQLAQHILCSKHIFLPVRRVTSIFVASDITTFVIQATGGGMSITHSLTQLRLAEHVFLAGLVLQSVSFILFCGMYARFLYRVYTLDRDIWERDEKQPWYRDWRTLAYTLVTSCICILVRCCYRVAEISQGFQGHLATTEAFFYGLDTLPLVIAIGVYLLCWPGWFIQDGEQVIED